MAARPTLPRDGTSRVLAERMQFMACVLVGIFTLGWCFWFSPYDDLLDRSGTPFGADFSMFYVAGQIVLDGHADQLYDQAEHQRRLQALFPGLDPRFALPYRYPPFVGLAMAPLAALPYVMACSVFIFASGAAAGTAAWLLARRLEILRGEWRKTILLSLAGWPVVLETLIGGQASLFGVLITSATILLLLDRRDVLAGAVLALALYKPNLLLLFGVGCVICRPRMLLGAVPVAIGALGLSWVTGGVRGIAEYAILATQLAGDSWDVATPFWKVHGISGLIEYVAPGKERLGAVLLGLITVGGVAIWWRQDERRGAQTPIGPLAILITINALANPYTPIYDLALLGVGAVLTAEFVFRRHGSDLADHMHIAQLMLAILFFGPHVSQLLARQTGVQLFTIALLFAAAWQARLVIRMSTNAGQFRAWASDG